MLLSLKILVLAVAFAAALEPPCETGNCSPFDYTPENFAEVESELHRNVEDFAFAQATLKGSGTGACKKMANSSKSSVRNAAKDLQKRLNAFMKDRACSKQGQSAVKQAERELRDATQHQKRCTVNYNKASGTQVNFGIRPFNSVTKGNCKPFYKSSAYVIQEGKVRASKAKLRSSNSRLANAKRGLATARANQVRLRTKCYCKAKKAYAALYSRLKARLAKEQTKTWKRAHYLLCVLKGTKQRNCSIAPLPKITKNMGILSSAARKTRCHVPFIGMASKTVSSPYTRAHGDQNCRDKFGSSSYWCFKRDVFEDGNKWTISWDWRCNGQYNPCCKRKK